MALLQMEADPGSLTGLSHQDLGCEAHTRLPLAAGTLQVGMLMRCAVYARGRLRHPFSCSLCSHFPGLPVVHMSPGNLPSTVVAAQWQRSDTRSLRKCSKNMSHQSSYLCCGMLRLGLCLLQGPVVASPSTASVFSTSHMADPTSSRALSSTNAATDQSGQGSESLRSSDEFPANKENNHSRFGTTQHASAAGAQHSMHAAGSESACMVSEQTLAQEAVYALQVTQCLFIMLPTHVCHLWEPLGESGCYHCLYAKACAPLC